MTETQKQYIEEHIKDKTIKFISSELKINFKTIKNYLEERNIRYKLQRTDWTSERMEYVKNNYYNKTLKEISNYLNISQQSIQSFAIRNNIAKKRVNSRFNNITRICVSCGIEYPKDKEHFNVNNTTRDGIVFKVYCKKCEKEKGILHNSKLKPFLNSLIQTTKRSRSKKRNAFVNNISLDRIDNSLPYIEGNVQLVCLWANYAKNTTTPEDFIYYITHTYNKLKQNEGNNN